MKEIDAIKGQGQLLRIAIASSLITGQTISIKNICNHYEKPGLTKSKLAVLNKIEELGMARIKGAGIGSSNIVIIPTNKELPKKIDIDLEGPSSTVLALDAILLPFIFADKKVNITIKGATHGNKSPPVSFYKETYWRYLKPYLIRGEVNATKLGCYPEIGELTANFEGKEPLNSQTPKLIIRKKPELAVIKAELINPNEEYLQRAEKLLNLAFKSKYAPFALTTRISPNEITALTLIAFFGNHEGYDNDNPYIKGNDQLTKGDLTEKELLEAAKKFQEELTVPFLDPHTADLLTPLMAFVGGELPISKLTDHMGWAIPVLENILGVKFKFENNILTCNGYASLLKEDIPSVDDL